LKERALTQGWTLSRSSELERSISRIHSTLSGLLQEYRKIFFQESGTEIAAELLLSPDAPQGILLFGINRSSNYQLAIKPDSPIIYEIANGTIRDTYPSIFHYLLIVEYSD